VIASWKHSKFDQYFIHVCNYLNCEAIEIFSNGSPFAPVLITAYNFGSAVTNVISGRHREVESFNLEEKYPEVVARMNQQLEEIKINPTRR
jgi:hypothetical protein